MPRLYSGHKLESNEHLLQPLYDRYQVSIAKEFTDVHQKPSSWVGSKNYTRFANTELYKINNVLFDVGILDYSKIMPHGGNQLHSRADAL